MKNAIFMTLVIVMGVVLLGGLTGCAAPGLTKEQVHQRHYEAIQNDLWQLQDDIDAFFLFDRPGRMSPMMVR
ncbi:MAG: hypothetical protein L0Y36_08205 [Planctomycetales bacterium]|nr:hypothetical protein [Planctomycetales bacterium]